MSEFREHIFLNRFANNISYTSRGRGHQSEIPEKDRSFHGSRLKTKLDSIWEEIRISKESTRESENENVATLRNLNGTYLEFVSNPDFSLSIKSLENKVQKIKLLNVRNKLIGNETIEYATVYIPKGKENFFSKKINDYLCSTLDNDRGNPRNKRLINSVSNIEIALVESFFPESHLRWIENPERDWYEIWLSDDKEEIISEFKSILTLLEIHYSNEMIVFPERTVLLVKVNKTDLVSLLELSGSIAEIRKGQTINTFFLDELSPLEQVEWINDVRSRTIKDIDDNEVVVNIIDTGIRRTHPLLEDFVDDDDMIAHDPSWNKYDGIIGHGTKMAGITLYSDLNDLLSNNDVINITYEIESSKILPDIGVNEPKLYGAITTDLVSRQIVKNPTKIRINCMAVTDPVIETYDGSPSSWSASIDSLTSGAVDEIQKLFIISAGNIPHNKWINYPEVNILSSVHNPGQSWNALTVGAYTTKASSRGISVPGFNAIANENNLSPSSTTSNSWDLKKWPIKPEVVFEGGNGISNGSEAYSEENFSSLTTNHDFISRPLTIINSTSEATAHASRMSAQILSEFPSIWPETVRALLVHSAEWTSEMKQQFLTVENMENYRKILRACGYGVPNLEKALNSFDNNVNLIIEETIQPYVKDNNRVKTNEMHLYRLPWPKDELLRMGESRVKLKVTLSYFVEPGPGEKGWRNNYRYPSALLRFELNGAQNESEFMHSINAETQLDDSEDNVQSGVRWKLKRLGNKGSIHSDVWEGRAADLATSNLLAVYPISGWWKERTSQEKYNESMRYSLIISLSTEEDVDIYTPIANEIQNPIIT